MHIEPGIVSGAKILFSYATAVASLGLAARKIWTTQRTADIFFFCGQILTTTVLVFSFFEIFPHYSIGVSEVHLIFASTLFLIFGIVPTAVGLACGLLIQGLFFCPFDLPQYGMNVTTLLMPLYVMDWIARSMIPRKCAYKDVQYWQALTLSTVYQAGVVTWVGFWVIYANGLSAATLNGLMQFALVYVGVIVIESFIDLAVLSIAKCWTSLSGLRLFQSRLYYGLCFSMQNE